jgi:hypothetical protein
MDLLADCVFGCAQIAQLGAFSTRRATVMRQGAGEDDLARLLCLPKVTAEASARAAPPG